MLSGIIFFIFAEKVWATVPPIPTDIEVIMIEYDPVTGLPTSNRCALNSIAFGCTARPDRPFPSANPVTVAIETRYLLDVVARETNSNDFAPLTLRAQAIAARSFGYWHLNKNEPISNSSQAFIPFSFELIGNEPDNSVNLCTSGNLTSAQQKVCTAVSPRTYMVHQSEEAPIFAAYNADIPDATTTYSEERPEYGRSRYLVGVAEPISPSGGCGVEVEGNTFGMSQQGAARWERGNICYTGRPAAPWSVQWTHTEQILSHYYTRINIRDADSNNSVMTPPLRWNPLQIIWDTTGTGEPPVMVRGQSYRVTVNVQNTGVNTWFCEEGIEYLFRSTFELRGLRVQEEGGVRICDLEPGVNRAVTLTVTPVATLFPSTYTLTFDMVRTSNNGNVFFSDPATNQPGGWPVYNIRGICVDCKLIAFLPILRR